MNHEKRKAIDALIVLVEIVRDTEEQDLEDTPDSIEFSSASDEFRSAINSLRFAIWHLETARNTVHKNEGAEASPK